jgi:hypothetical protein
MRAPKRVRSPVGWIAAPTLSQPRKKAGSRRSRSSSTNCSSNPSAPRPNDAACRFVSRGLGIEVRQQRARTTAMAKGDASRHPTETPRLRRQCTSTNGQARTPLALHRRSSRSRRIRRWRTAPSDLLPHNIVINADERCWACSHLMPIGAAKHPTIAMTPPCLHPSVPIHVNARIAAPDLLPASPP